MGRTKAYHPVKLIMAVCTTDPALWDSIRPGIETRFSPIDMQSEWYEFLHTDYYSDEMGKHLKKRFVSFQNLISASSLPDIKLATNAIEEAQMENGNRRINLDPGYLCAPKLVLATTKDFSHRIYLRDGIFADLHLSFRGKHFVPQPWTYPDYREPFVTRFFEEVRVVYLEQLGLEGFELSK